MSELPARLAEPISVIQYRSSSPNAKIPTIEDNIPPQTPASEIGYFGENMPLSDAITQLEFMNRSVEIMNILKIPILDMEKLTTHPKFKLFLEKNASILLALPLVEIKKGENLKKLPIGYMDSLCVKFGDFLVENPDLGVIVPRLSPESRLALDISTLRMDLLKRYEEYKIWEATRKQQNRNILRSGNVLDIPPTERETINTLKQKYLIPFQSPKI